MNTPNILSRALTLAVAHHIDCLKSSIPAGELYPLLKAYAQEGAYFLAMDIPDFVVSAEHKYLAVSELLERVEVSANQMVEFGQLMLQAVQQGLNEACGSASVPDVDLNELAERFILTAWTPTNEFTR